MNPTLPTAIRNDSQSAAGHPSSLSSPMPSRWERFPALPVALTIGLLALLMFPQLRANRSLVWTFSGIAAALFAWELALWAIGKRKGQLFRVEFIPVKSHYVQAAVQLTIMLYWGWHAREVYAQMPLILAQLLFLYSFEGLLTWSRGRTWRLGFGPLPIIFSTNLLLWFKDDWFFLQFAMVALGGLGKQFFTWERDGKKVHIFNPSAFGQSLIAIALIVTGTTNDLTWGREIAQTFEAPHMLLVIFGLGLIVQYLFQVTLMTLSAAATLGLFNLVYTAFTGTYFFVNISIAAPIFLGIHLLVTDPSTSPKTNLGKVIFGSIYALGYCALFRIFDLAHVPLFWDKLLPVPILNLCVPLIDRWMHSGVAGKLSQLWETAMPARKLNLVHMGCWIALFGTMVATGFVEGPHKGDSIPFWKKAYAEGKPHAGHSLVMAVGSQAEGNGSSAAFNELGLICMEGKIVKENRSGAARYFSRACELGNLQGCANVAAQFLFLRERRTDEDVARALDRLERECEAGTDGLACYLVGSAYETGRGRPMDSKRAIELYRRCGNKNLYASKALARIALSGGFDRNNPIVEVAQLQEKACEAGDAESCWYLAYMFHGGIGVRPDEAKTRALIEKACKLGSRQACDALQQPKLPPYSNPQILLPAWSTAFPMQD